ncbi:MAG: Ig-like domain-containing protein [Verrucomicrobiales bacterium]
MKRPHLSLIGAVLAIFANFQASPALAQATRVADLNPGSTGSYPSNLTAYADSLVFSAYTQATGFELWRFNGSFTQLVGDINSTFDEVGSGVREGNDSLPAWLTPCNGNLYFSAYDPRKGAELWRYDGSTVSLVADVSPDVNDTIKQMPNSSWPSQLTVFNNNLYFTANSATIATNYELWRFDGAIATQVANIHPDADAEQSSYPSGLTVFNGALYFMANDGANGYELWKHDGTSTVMLANINPGGAESSSFPKFFTQLNGFLYFQAYSEATGFELWKTDGSSVSLAADIYPGPESGSPNSLKVFNGELFFMATDGVAGYELWKYDESNARLVRDINLAGDSYPKNFSVFQNNLYFVADDGVHGWELWKYDGTRSDLVADVNTGGSSFPEELTVFDGKLYFVSETSEAGREIWVHNGSSVALASDINPGSGSSFPQFFTVFNGQLFFRAAEDGVNDFELWRLAPAMNQSPVVSLTAPQSGESFTTVDTIIFTATASDLDGIANVEFFANGTLIGSDATAPYAVSTTLTGGIYSITAKAADALGAVATSATVSITVNNPNQTPVVSLSSPPAGATFLAGETITFAANASDDTSISNVEFFANEISLGFDATVPYSISTSLPVGSYSITAKATDNLGMTVTSTSIQISVGSQNQAPSITLASAQAGTVLLAPAAVTLRATATDSDGAIAKVEFYQGDALIGTSTSEAFEWVVANLAAGTYSFKAVATDNTGASQSSATIQVVVTDQPIINSIQKSRNSVAITVTGTPDRPVTLQWSPDLQTWNQLQTQTSEDGLFTFTDSALEAQRFYRAVIP